MKKNFLMFAVILLITMTAIPTAFVLLYENGTPIVAQEEKVPLKIDPSKNLTVTVYRSKTAVIESYPLEEYVRGVIAAEMPINFELEALKAQALAARTYIIKKMLDKSFSAEAKGAMVTDTVKDQVFLSDEELRKIWGYKYEKNISKLNIVINETIGQVITYQNQPITALYFSTSNGYTENSEDYWQKEVPYLRSVPSVWDLQSPKYAEDTFIPFSELQSKLGVDSSVAVSTNQSLMKVLEKTEGDRVKKMQIGQKILSGREVRELFDLKSSSFTWDITESGVMFHTKGFGHGVGMSQYGANGMAKEGNRAEDIVSYYYTGTEVTNIEKWLKPKEV